MRFDIHCALGHWPFQKVPGSIPVELRTALISKGIEGAAVVNTQGLFYKNCHDANLELSEWISDNADFFVGVATLNPLYPAWERDLPFCRHTLHFRALRLAPQYHNYRLDGGEAKAIATLAAELDMPILIPHWIMDVRQRHWFDTERTIGMDEIGALCSAVSQAHVIITDSPFAGDLLLQDEAFRYPNLYVDSTRVGIAGLPETVAAKHVLFGTGAPFKSITPALLRLDMADISASARRAIEGDTARALLGLA